MDFRWTCGLNTDGGEDSRLDLAGLNLQKSIAEPQKISPYNLKLYATLTGAESGGDLNFLLSSLSKAIQSFIALGLVNPLFT